MSNDDDRQLGEEKTCFVVSPIGNKLSPLGTQSRVAYEDAIQIWDNVLKPACEVFGLQPIRADKMAQPGELPEQIFQLLRDSDVVIADLTGGNSNVMYELGLRHTRDLLTVQIGEYERLPFDVNTIRTVQYVRTESGLIDLRNSLIGLLRAGLRGEATPVTATRVWNELMTDPEMVARAVEASSAPDVEDVDDTADEPGFMDVLAEGEESMTSVSEDMERATGAMEIIGEIFQSSVEKVSDSDSQGRGFAGRLAIARGIAEGLDEPTTELEEAANSFRENVSRVDAAMSYLFSRLESGDEDPTDPEVVEFLEQIETLASAASEAEPGVSGIMGAAKGLRKVSRVLNDPSKRISSALNRFLSSMRLIVSWGERARGLREGGDAC